MPNHKFIYFHPDHAVWGHDKLNNDRYIKLTKIKVENMYCFYKLGADTVQIPPRHRGHLHQKIIVDYRNQALKQRILIAYVFEI